MVTQHHRKEDITDEDKKLSGFGLLIKYPWKVAMIIITAVITIIAIWNGINNVDDRYFHTTEAIKMETSIKQTLGDIKDHAKFQRQSIQKESVEDKLFEIEMKTQLSAYDKALADRYKRRLEEINSKIKDKTDD
jgi:hypothetical protein